MAKIIKNLPIPIAKAGSGSIGMSIYDFHLMEVGDAIKFKVESKNNKYTCSARNYGKKCGKKFTTRFSKGITTIWRIK
jgi:hypothetical protein